MAGGEDLGTYQAKVEFDMASFKAQVGAIQNDLVEMRRTLQEFTVTMGREGANASRQGAEANRNFAASLAGMMTPLRGVMSNLSALGLQIFGLQTAWNSVRGVLRSLLGDTLEWSNALSQQATSLAVSTEGLNALQNSL